jgi:hypothetical protein
MTNEAEPRTPLDDAIDVIAHAMTGGPVPDLRLRIAERLDARGSAVMWERPALASALIVAALAAWWLDPRIDTSSTPAPNPSAAIRSGATGGAPSISFAAPERRAQVPRRPRRSRSNAMRGEPDPWPQFSSTIERIDVTPISVDALDMTTPPIDVVEVSSLVVEPIVVEPLPRSNP